MDLESCDWGPIPALPFCVTLEDHFPSLGFSFPSCKGGHNTCSTSQGLQVSKGLCKPHSVVKRWAKVHT